MVPAPKSRYTREETERSRSLAGGVVSQGTCVPERHGIPLKHPPRPHVRPEDTATDRGTVLGGAGPG